MKSRVATFAVTAIAGLLLTTPIAETKITVHVPTVQQSIRYNYEYKFAGETVVIGHCRRDDDKPGYPATRTDQDYCTVYYPDRPKRNGFTIQSAELRSDMIKKLRALESTQPTNSGPGALVASAATPQAGTAVLSVASGFQTQPGTVDPLFGKTLVLFKEGFENFMRRTRMFEGPPGSSVKASPLAVWVYACQTQSPVCPQALYEMRPNAVSEVKMGSSGRATLPGVPAGSYYLFAVTAHNKQALVWDLRVDLKPGANSVTLDQRNAARLDADSAQANPSAGRSDPIFDSRPCAVTDAPRTAKPGARTDSALSVRGAGYVYTYKETDRRTGQVAHSFTERGNFSNTTLYLLDEDAEKVFQMAGIKPVIFPIRLSLIESVNFYDAFGEVKNVPGVDILTALPGGQGLKQDLESGGPAKAEFDCAMKAIRSHSVAEMTTDANARGTFPRVPAGTYHLYGRFYRIQKPFRGGGMVWNLKVVVKPGQNTLILTVNNAAYK